MNVETIGLIVVSVMKFVTRNHSPRIALKKMHANGLAKAVIFLRAL